MKMLPKGNVINALLSVLLLCASMAAGASNEGCVPLGSTLSCTLQIGTFEYVISSPLQVLELNNSSDADIQINQVWAIPAFSNLWGEYCAYLAEFSDTGQSEPGIGEVGCIHKEPWELSYSGLEWDGYNTALSIPAGKTIHIQGNVHTGNDPSDLNWDNVFYVTSYPQSRGVYSWRQPRHDFSMICDGNIQWSDWNPWQNITGHALAISGATTYAVTPGGHQVTEACAYILDVNGNVRWSHCGLNQRGKVDFSGAQTVQPGEFVAAQAINICSPGGGALWDWAAFIYTYNL